MDLFGIVGAAWTNLWYYVPAFLFIITIIIAVHEYGHFAVARWCGVGISTFSIGFGKEIAGFTDKHGTRWRLALMPLGGYVKFIDDDNPTSVPTQAQGQAGAVDPRSYHGKPVWQRAAIAVAGPIANFILAIVVFGVTYGLVGEQIIPPRVDGVEAGSVAEKAGFQKGDVVKSIDGGAIDNFRIMQLIVASSCGRTIQFQVDRGGQLVDLVAAPNQVETPDEMGGTLRYGRLGIIHNGNEQEVVQKVYGPIGAVLRGTQQTQYVISASLRGIWDILRGCQKLDQLAGPTKLVEVSGRVASYGFDQLLQFLAVVSVGIGLFNLFPIPMLDGGHLAMYAIEAVRGRPLSERTQEMAFRVGFSLVLMLLILTIGNHLREKLTFYLG